MRRDATVDDRDYQKTHVVQLLRPHRLQKLRVHEVVHKRSSGTKMCQHTTLDSQINEHHCRKSQNAPVAAALQHAADRFTEKLMLCVFVCGGSVRDQL
jgi:hypothetical protein